VALVLAGEREAFAPLPAADNEAWLLVKPSFWRTVYGKNDQAS
jgi:hypothetical protein